MVFFFKLTNLENTDGCKSRTLEVDGGGGCGRVVLYPLLFDSHQREILFVLLNAAFTV